MSVQINCDRCGADTGLYFLNAKVEITRGSYASVPSKVSPARDGLPFRLDWHICETCARALRGFRQAPPEAAS